MRDRVSCTSSESVCMKQEEAVHILYICVVLVTCMCACAHSGWLCITSRPVFERCDLGSVGIYSTGNGTGNPVHLPSPDPYPTCVLTNFRCRVVQLVRSLLIVECVCAFLDLRLMGLGSKPEQSGVQTRREGGHVCLLKAVGTMYTVSLVGPVWFPEPLGVLKGVWGRDYGGSCHLYDLVLP